MKILWLCNVMLPEVSKILGLEINSRGGWLITMAEQISMMNDSQFVICCPFDGERRRIETSNVSYYLFNENNASLDAHFRDILVKETPDVVHIFGTEFKHTYDMILACQKVGLIHKVVISIQGLVSVYAKHYSTGLNWFDIHSFTLRDLIKRDNIHRRQKDFEHRGKYECMALESVDYVIGRTDWDECCVRRINPAVKYIKCNETLRPSFYHHRWDYNNCKKHTIFVSQCNYPVKGLHMLIDYLPEILEEYPDTKVYTTGPSPFTDTGALKKGLTYYKVLLAKKLQKLNLEDHVVFLGNLNEDDMCNQYLKSNVFVSCSTIENSPNSIGEAMLLGMPVVTSDVGGVKNMVDHRLEGFLYPLDEPYMLPYYIKKCFQYDESIHMMIENAHKHALMTHNVDDNFETLVSVYHRIEEFAGEKHE